FVLLDAETGGEIAGLPVAALRVEGVPLIARRPVVHPPRLSQLGCVEPVRPKHSLVIADAKGDLVNALLEAVDLATHYHFTPALGSAATSDAVFSAGPDDYVHLAVHAFVQPSGGALQLHDRRVSALEISARRTGPSLVFVAACSSAMANDGELATSLATAFLAAGSPQVLATLRPVNDGGTAEIAKAFYAHDGIADPARALARIQTALAQTRNADWPNFVLYGHDICRKESP